MTRSDSVAVEGGLADPVFDSQAIFSLIMNAFARPGTIVGLGDRVTAPAPVVPAAAAFLATLADFDTPVWLDEPLKQAEGLAAWIAFQTGAPLTENPEAARFAVLADAQSAAELDRFAIGTPAYPDRSATVLVPVEDLEGGAPLTLAGPGIEGQARIAPRGLPSACLAAAARNAALFPLGLDFVLVCGTRALALPRTTGIGSA